MLSTTVPVAERVPFLLLAGRRRATEIFSGPSVPYATNPATEGGKPASTWCRSQARNLTPPVQTGC
ncbi:hypothetical protein SK128_014719 [Halocaridina rubra]|uniref:Uncharacterized protein n=1 Tax=Halocaridina rubra TaxID=373956 RepID=A0AAN8WPY9_HALRR